MHINEQMAEEFIHAEWVPPQPAWPDFALKINPLGKGEKYSTTFHKRKIEIKAESPLAAVYAVSQLRVAAASGQLGDFLGACQPRFALRPIWVGCGSLVAINAEVSVGLPDFFASLQGDKATLCQTIECFCRRILELGYNAVILGERENCFSQESQIKASQIEEFCKQLQAHQIKVILKPSFNEIQKKKCCPLNQNFVSWLTEKIKDFKAIPSFDFFLWDSSLRHAEFSNDPAVQESTLSELVTAEAQLLERLLPSRISLIYFISSQGLLDAQQQAQWMGAFCDDVHKNTIVSFSCVAGNSFEDHLLPHPFWEQLRKSPDISATKLLPMVNVGQICQGEGLWPALALDLLEKYYSRLYRHHFAGAVALVNKLPKPGGILDCSLWVAGQMLWRDLSASLLAETWMKAYRPRWGCAAVFEILTGVRQLVVEMSYLRSLTQEAKRDAISSEECRSMTESLLARLKDLQMRAHKFERVLKSSNHPSLVEYLQIFGRDATRIVLHFLQCFNLSYPTIINQEDQQESFWHQSAAGAGQGIRSAVKVSFLNEPYHGTPGSAMDIIYKENRWI